MFKAVVKLRPEAPNMPLRPVWVGAASDALFVLSGVPEGFAARLYLTPPGGGETVFFDASVNGAAVYVHASGANFPAAGCGGSYEVAFTDPETGNTYWCGKGLVNVMKAAGGGSFDGGKGNTLDAYARNPATGLWHKITVEFNDDGHPTTNIEQQGIHLHG